MKQLGHFTETSPSKGSSRAPKSVLSQRYNKGWNMISSCSEAGEFHVIAPSLGRRFSGVNASMISLLPEQAKHIRIAAMGFNLPEGMPRISFRQFWHHCGRRRWLIWHARRNVDMLAGLILRHVFRLRLILIFTWAAQRTPSWVTRFYCRHMDRLIATTSAAASFLTKEASVIQHGVNIDRFAPPEDRAAAWARHGLPGRYGIGVFGRVRPQKGSEEFIDAMIRVLPQRADWTAVVIGETTGEFLTFEQRLRKKVRDAGLIDRIHFTGFLKDCDEIPEWYRALSVVVCPSRNEGFGLSCLEAMASGCPVIATRTGAWPELVSDEVDGYLIPCADADALAAAVLRITEDIVRVRYMGEQARDKIVKNCRIQNEAEGINRVYRQLLATRGVSI